MRMGDLLSSGGPLLRAIPKAKLGREKVIIQYMSKNPVSTVRQPWTLSVKRSQRPVMEDWYLWVLLGRDGIHHLALQG